jgi:hypothetical protein
MTNAFEVQQSPQFSNTIMGGKPCWFIEIEKSWSEHFQASE